MNTTKTALILCGGPGYRRAKVSNSERSSNALIRKVLGQPAQVNIIRTNSNLCTNNCKYLEVPIHSSRFTTNKKTKNFTEGLKSILGNRKIDLVMFEYCSLLHQSNSNLILRTLRPFMKNDSRVITHTNKQHTSKFWGNNWLVMNSIHQRNHGLDKVKKMPGHVTTVPVYKWSK
jgi:hypothetical protein